MGSSARRDRVVDALGSTPRLAGLYVAALTALETEPLAGREVVRVMSICHYMRELMQGLPALLSDSAIPRPKPSSSALVAKLPRLLAAHPDLDLRVEQDLVPVPKAVARALSSIAVAATQEEGRNRNNAAALVTGRSDTRHPAVRQWRETYDFFVGWAHLDRNFERSGEFPSDAEMLSRIRVVEDLVEVRTAAFFDNLHAIEALLTEINAADERGE